MRKDSPFHEVLIVCSFQVVITDVLEEDGAATEREFKTEYGEDRILFVKGDVTKQEDMEGVWNYLS